MAGEEGLAMTMDKLSSITPGVTHQLQDFCELALENIKVYRPEITRLDVKTDAISRELAEMAKNMRMQLENREEEHKLVQQRCNFMEERMMKLEALVAVLPTWKEDLVSKIDAVGREGRVRHEQMSMRTQMLEDQHTSHVQTTRERLDTLSQLARTMAEARAQHSDRMDGLEKQIRAVDSSTTYNIKELQATTEAQTRDIQTNQRKLVEHGALLSMNRIDIDALRQKALEAEKEIDKNTANILELQDKQDLFHNNIVLMDKQLKSNEVQREALGERVNTLEKDTRVQALQATAQDYVAFKSQVADFMHTKLQDDKGLEKRLADMDARIDKGPPGLWKITEQVAAQALELARHRDELTDASVRLGALDDALAAARKALADQKHEALSMQSDGKALSDKMTNEVKRIMHYVDSRLNNLCARYEVEAMRKLIEQVKRELHDAIASMGHRVKFELLHDEVPQVNTLKAYIQQSEQAMARTMDRLGWLEAGLNKENERVEQMAGEWCTTKSALDAMILDGTFDVARMKRELQGFKDMFEELGRMAARGQIITVAQAEALVDKAIRGPAVDAVVGKKLMDSKILRNELQGYVPRHELEGLRNIIAANSALVLMASNAGAVCHPAPVPEPVRTPSPDTQHKRTTTTGVFERLSNTSSSRHASPPHQHQYSTQNQENESEKLTGPPAPPPAARLTVEDSALLAVYQRLAAIDQALAVNNALSGSLQDKVDSAVHTATAAALQVEADVPTFRSQLSDLQDQVSKVRSGHTESAYAESAVRRMVNKTVLPEVIERQAGDTRRLVQYVTRHMTRMADADQVKDLTAIVETLRKRLDTMVTASTDSEEPAEAVSAVAISREASAGTAVLSKEGSRPAGLSKEGSQTMQDLGSVTTLSKEASKAARNSKAASLAVKPSKGQIFSDLQPPTDSNHQQMADEKMWVPEVVSLGVLSLGAQPSKEASSTLEELIMPSHEQQATMVRTLDVRLEAMEQLVVELQAAVERLAVAVPADSIASGSAETASKDAALGGADADGEVSPRRRGSVSADVADQISDLKVQVLELVEQLPLLAKGYEVEGLRRALANVQMVVNARGAAGGASQLNITLACPQQGQHSTTAVTTTHTASVGPSRQVSRDSSMWSKAPSPEPSALLGVASFGPASRQASRLSSVRSNATISETANASGASPLSREPSHATAVDTAHTAVLSRESSRAACLRSQASAARAGQAEQPGTALQAETSQNGMPPHTAQASQGEGYSVGHVFAPQNMLLAEPSQADSNRAVEEEAAAASQRKPLESVSSQKSFRRSSTVKFEHGLTEEELKQQGEDAHRQEEMEKKLQEERHAEHMSATADCYTVLQQHCAWQQVVAGQLAEQVANLQIIAVTADERATAVEKRWLSSLAKWQQGMSLLQEALPRMEHLASTTQRRVHHILNHTAQFVVKGQLDELTSACESIRQLKSQIHELQAAVSHTRFDGHTSSAPQTPKVAKNKQAPKARSNLAVTDLSQLSLPLPQLLPSFTNQPSSPRGTDGSGAEEDTVQEAADSAAKPEQHHLPSSGSCGALHDRGVSVQGTLSGRNSPEANIAADGSSIGGNGMSRQASRHQPQGGRVGSTNPPVPHPGVPGWGTDGTPRHLHRAEHADTELAGIMHDVMHANYRELLVTKDGPLPGAAAQDQGQGPTIREAALKRLRTKPYEVQKHVELLESARKQLERLVGTTAVSTTDYVALCCLMLDVRVKLMEDHVEVHKEQVSTAFRNLESAFAYLKKLQEAVNSKGSLAALSAVDQCLRSLGKEMVLMGHGPTGAGQPGLLHGQTIGTTDFWSPFLSMGGADMTSPPRSPAGKRPTSSLHGNRPLTPSTPSPAQVIPIVTGTTFTLSGSPFPPPSFMKDKRDVIVEQQRVIATLKAAEVIIHHGNLPTVQYVASQHAQAGVGGTGLPVLARKRPSTARPDVRTS